MSALRIGVISPQDWNLPVAPAGSEPIPGLNVAADELERRVRHCTEEWLPRHFDEQVGAFYGFYHAPTRQFEPPQTVNLIAPWQLLATYDRYRNETLLTMARRATDWFYERFVVAHPMSVVIGGVRESLPNGGLWTKFSAEFVLLNLGLYQRTGDHVFLDRARKSLGFLIQSTRYNFAPRYDPTVNAWQTMGWQSFGRVVEAFLLMAEVQGSDNWHTYARRWGEHGLSLLQSGGLYLIDGDYFNTDIAADELRAFTFLYELTGETRFLEAAEAFAAWLLVRQRPDGAWPLTVDRDDNLVVETIGPGDVPNIAMAFFRLHAASGNEAHLNAAKQALNYSLTQQVLPDGDGPYADDPNVQWGFWSWDPYYDYTLSGDQATHHVRGYLFAIDYLASLP